MPRLAKWLAALARNLGSEVLIAHPYEGGHPDHDAGAWVAQRTAGAAANRGAEGPVARRDDLVPCAGGRVRDRPIFGWSVAMLQCSPSRVRSAVASAR